MREEKENRHVTIWDDDAGIGLRFQEGEILQRYTASIMTTAKGLLTLNDLEKFKKIVKRIEEEAAKIYPIEFAELL